MTSAWPERRHDGQLLGYQNPRARLFGWFWIVCGLILLLVPFDVESPSLGLVVFGIVWALLTAAFGLRTLFGFRLRIAPPWLELRSIRRTRRISLKHIEQCRATTGSAGLIYRRTYPEIVLSDGSSIPFSDIQWAPDDLASAEQACREITAAISAAR